MAKDKTNPTGATSPRKKRELTATEQELLKGPLSEMAAAKQKMKEGKSIAKLIGAIASASEWALTALEAAIGARRDVLKSETKPE